MNRWKLLVLAAAVAGGVAVVLRRRNQQATAEADLWAEATDYVTRNRPVD